MRGYIFLVYIGLGLILAGCTNDQRVQWWGVAPLPFTPEFYRLPHLDPLSTPLMVVAVYQFKDKRLVAGPTVLGEQPIRTGTSGHAVVYATEHVGTGVARAFLDGLRARGLQILDRTMNPVSGEHEKEPGMIAISGEVLEFAYSSRRTGLVSYAGGAVFHVRVQVYDAKGAKVHWEKSFSKTSDVFIINSQLVFLSRSLAESVEDVMNDPTFFKALRYSPGSNAGLSGSRSLPTGNPDESGLHENR